jgi:hypothetical protein
LTWCAWEQQNTKTSSTPAVSNHVSAYSIMGTLTSGSSTCDAEEFSGGPASTRSRVGEAGRVPGAGYLGALEGDGAELLGEAVGEEDRLERGRAREVLGIVAGASSAAGLLLRHGCGGGEALRSLAPWLGGGGSVWSHSSIHTHHVFLHSPRRWAAQPAHEISCGVGLECELAYA